MTIIIFICKAYLITYIVSIGIHLLKKYGVLNWIKHSINYPFKKRRTDKLFKSLPDNQRRDLWLYSDMNLDESKWYYRRLEKFIREKYIEPIVNNYGTIRAD
jgi:hypothetical protein